MFCSLFCLFCFGLVVVVAKIFVGRYVLIVGCVLLFLRFRARLTIGCTVKSHLRLQVICSRTCIFPNQSNILTACISYSISAAMILKIQIHASWWAKLLTKSSQCRCKQSILKPRFLHCISLNSYWVILMKTGILLKIRCPSCETSKKKLKVISQLASIIPSFVQSLTTNYI